MQPVIVIHESEDNLYRERWVFDWYHGHGLMLCRYHKERQELGRWRLLEFYDRENDDGSGPWVSLRERDVPWDEDLKAEAIQALASSLKVGRPLDFGLRKRRK